MEGRGQGPWEMMTAQVGRMDAELGANNIGDRGKGVGWGKEGILRVEWSSK